ncbi:sporulation histidine kinase inhibitor Sda [Paenibacillus abyssi]
MRNFIKLNYSSRRHDSRLSLEQPLRFVPARASEVENDPNQDKTILLKPLNDEHLIEVYREAQAMRLSDDFIRLIENAMEQRNLPVHEMKNR